MCLILPGMYNFGHTEYLQPSCTFPYKKTMRKEPSILPFPSPALRAQRSHKPVSVKGFTFPVYQQALPPSWPPAVSSWSSFQEGKELKHVTSGTPSAAQSNWKSLLFHSPKSSNCPKGERNSKKSPSSHPFFSVLKGEAWEGRLRV